MKRILLFLSLFPFFISTNVYSQWLQVPNSPAGFIRNIVEYNNVIYISHSNTGVYKSIDGLNSWQQINNGLITNQSKQVFEVFLFNDNLYAATTDGVYKSTDDGSSWIKKSNGITIGPGALYEFAESVFEYSGVLFAGAYNGIYRSTDSGESWIITNVAGEAAIPKNFTDHNGILFAARETFNSPAGYKSFDDGLTWKSIPNQQFGNIITFLSEPGKLWAGTIFGVWVSTDNGNTWEQRENGLFADPYSASIIRVNNDLYTSLKFGGSGVFRSTNQGLNWEDFNDGLPFLSQIDKLMYYDNKIIAATTDGLWWRELSLVPVELISFTASVDNNGVLLNWVTASESNNWGFEIQQSEMSEVKSQTWGKIGFINGKGTSTKQQAYSFADKNLSAGNYQYRLKQIDYDGSFEFSEIVQVNIVIPGEFSLQQNYPNPFNPATKIKYTIPAPVIASETKLFQLIQLKVYDVLGNEIATLVNEQKPAGIYEVEFDGANLSSGVYYYKFQAGDFVETKKMILLK